MGKIKFSLEVNPDQTLIPTKHLHPKELGRQVIIIQSKGKKGKECINDSELQNYQDDGTKRKATNNGGNSVKGSSKQSKKFKATSDIITIEMKTMGETKSRYSKIQKKKHSMTSQPSSVKVINKKSRIPRREKWRCKGVNTEKRLNHPAGTSRRACTGKLIALAASLAFIRLYETTPPLMLRVVT